MIVENYVRAIKCRRDLLKEDLKKALSHPSPDWPLVHGIKAKRTRLKDMMIALLSGRWADSKKKKAPNIGGSATNIH